MAHIVIVEDDPAVGAAYADVLRDHGHDVALFATVADADTAIADAPVDLMLLDLWLPETGGLDYLKALAARETMPRVIAISGGGKGRSLESALTIAEVRGAVSSLVKPVTDDELIAAINAALER